MASPVLTPPISSSSSASTTTTATTTTTASIPQGWSKELRRYTKEQVVDQSPSRKHGMSFEEEKFRRAQMITIIYETLQDLHLSVYTSGLVAATFFHHFFMKFSFHEFDAFEVACACVFLAAKIEDQKYNVQTVVEKCHKARSADKTVRYAVDSKEGREFCRRVLDQEVLVLQVMGFHLKFATVANCNTQLSKRYLQKDIDENILKKIVYYSMWMMRAMHKSVAILIYSPQELSIALLVAAMDCPAHTDTKYSYREYTNTPRDWFKQHLPNFTYDNIYEIVQYFHDLIEEIPESARTAKPGDLTKDQLIDFLDNASRKHCSSVIPELASSSSSSSSVGHKRERSLTGAFDGSDDVATPSSPKRQKH
eukprot:TRINITY_DN3764_c0_g1_i1.p1 TRINITY_DN3764_c0_g1~~TRINITY_DN3764_c0_g1_i1.p1  ORF type:complete len:366 (-),score=98.33 TRINITY_DN3764_c0_g1_i1:272-1369(-)